ncbi:MAG: hypothetical protein HY719_04565 [Planctomycetes bacterium]|nr:hypothetical protein [Planctomycetota bacterium]
MELSAAVMKALKRMVASTLREVIADTVKPLFDAVNQRIDGLAVRLDGVEKRLDVVETRLDGMDRRLDGMDRRLDGMDQRLDGMDRQLDSLARGMIALLEAGESHFNLLSELAMSLPGRKRRVEFVRRVRAEQQAALAKFLRREQRTENPLTKAQVSRARKYLRMIKDGEAFTLAQAQDFYEVAEDGVIDRNLPPDMRYAARMLLGIAGLVRADTQRAHYAQPRRRAKPRPSAKPRPTAKPRPRAKPRSSRR